VTPELQAAIDRVSAYLDAVARNHPNVAEIDMEIAHTDDPNQWLERPLMAADLRTILAALDPAEQPIDRIPTPAGLDYLANRRQQHPKADADA
jgi:hypothetical protein